MTAEEKKDKIRELNAEIKRLREEIKKDGQHLRRTVSDELIQKYGNRLGFKALDSQKGVFFISGRYGKTVESFSCEVRRQLFPEKLVKTSRGNNKLPKLFTYTDEEYAVYTKIMSRMCEFLELVDDSVIAIRKKKLEDTP